MDKDAEDMPVGLYLDEVVAGYHLEESGMNWAVSFGSSLY